MAVVLLLLAGGMSVSPVMADSQGPNNPSTATSENVDGPDVAWNNPTNVLSDDGQYATATLQQAGVGGVIPTQTLLVRGFNFAIPTGATINGIEVFIDRSFVCAVGSGCSADAGFISDEFVALVRDGVANTQNKATATAWPASDADATYGGPADLWNAVWTPELINGNFGVAIQAKYNATGDARTARVDHVTITVTYTPLDTMKVNTTTSVTCDSPVTLGESSSCTAVVTRASGGNTPSESPGVGWGATDFGDFVSAGPCAQDTSAGTLTCAVTYTPSHEGMPTVLAYYFGDENFNTSQDETDVTVTLAALPVPAMTLFGLLFSGLGLGLLGARRMRRKQQ